MASIPRYLIIRDGSSFHVTVQCHNRAGLMKSEWAKKLFYEYLLKWKDAYGVSIYSYKIMDNKIHLVGKIVRKEGLSHFMKKVTFVFSQAYNRKNDRCGSLFLGKFKAQCVQPDKHILDLIAKIDLNLFGSKTRKNPEDYNYSSYHYYASGKEDQLITPAPSYMELADDNKERCRQYRQMLKDAMRSSPGRDEFISPHFLGNPDWVRENCNCLKGWFKKKCQFLKEGTQIDCNAVRHDINNMN